MLRLRLADSGFTFSSAGLRAVDGAPMDAAAARQLVSHGGDPAGLIGEQLTGQHVQAADLILTMTRRQRDDVVRQFPRAMRRSFSLAEFAMLATLGDFAPATDPRIIVEEAGRRRYAVTLKDADDVIDPINASEDVHRAVAAHIVQLVDVIAAVFTGNGCPAAT